MPDRIAGLYYLKIYIQAMHNLIPRVKYYFNLVHEKRNERIEYRPE